MTGGKKRWLPSVQSYFCPSYHTTDNDENNSNDITGDSDSAKPTNQSVVDWFLKANQ